jgi:hypothetical protein
LQISPSSASLQCAGETGKEKTKRKNKKRKMKRKEKKEEEEEDEEEEEEEEALSPQPSAFLAPASPKSSAPARQSNRLN